MPTKFKAADGTRLLTRADVARITQHSLRSVDYWVATRVLPHIKFPRRIVFLADDVQKFIEDRRIGGIK
jgi:hypothetical protein